MKRPVCLFICITIQLAAITATAQVKPADSIRYSKELIRLEQALMDTIPSGNTALWEQLLDPAFFIVTEDGSRLERAAFLQTIHPLPPGFSGYIKIIRPKLNFNNDMAVVSYLADEHEFVFDQQLHTSYSTMDTWIRKNGLWKLLVSQVFEVPQLPPAIALPAAQQAVFTGVYRLMDTISCTIIMQHDTLFIQKKTGSKQALLPETPTIFFRQTDSRGRKIFATDAAGRMQMLERRNGQDLVWKRISH